MPRPFPKLQRRKGRGREEFAPNFLHSCAAVNAVPTSGRRGKGEKKDRKETTSRQSDTWERVWGGKSAYPFLINNLFF